MGLGFPLPSPFVRPPVSTDVAALLSASRREHRTRGLHGKPDPAGKRSHNWLIYTVESGSDEFWGRQRTRNSASLVPPGNPPRMARGPGPTRQQSISSRRFIESGAGRDSSRIGTPVPTQLQLRFQSVPTAAQSETLSGLIGQSPQRHQVEPTASCARSVAPSPTPSVSSVPDVLSGASSRPVADTGSLSPFAR